MVVVLAVCLLALGEVEYHQVGVSQTGIALHQEEVTSLRKVVVLQVKALDALELVYRQAVNKLLIALLNLERQMVVRILVYQIIYAGITHEQLQVLVIAIYGTLLQSLCVKILIKLTNLGNIDVGELLDFAIRLQEVGEDLVSSLGMVAYLALSGALLAVGDEV